MVNAIYILKTEGTEKWKIMPVIKQITGRTQYVAGCLQVGIWESAETSEIMVNEQWRSLDDLKKHINSKLYKKMLSALEMSTEMPVVSFMESDRNQGFELIEEVLNVED
jgi:quinol monooxygenase YgiN